MALRLRLSEEATFQLDEEAISLRERYREPSQPRKSGLAKLSSAVTPQLQIARDSAEHQLVCGHKFPECPLL